MSVSMARRGVDSTTGQRRMAPNSRSTAPMQAARSSPTSSSVNVWSGAQNRRR